MKLDNRYYLEYSNYRPHFYCYSQRFDQYVLWSSSSVWYRTQEPTQNLKLNPFLNHRGRLFQFYSIHDLYQ